VDRSPTIKQCGNLVLYVLFNHFTCASKLYCNFTKRLWLLEIVLKLFCLPLLAFIWPFSLLVFRSLVSLLELSPEAGVRAAVFR